MHEKSLTKNIKSGCYISLIALPLCLGIAIASSCPPIAGVITAIIGGVLVSFFGGCELSIKGPAAGLIVVILAAVQDLGSGDLELGYRRMLAVAVFAAIVQIMLATFKLARFGRLMPPSIIHGMLAAIGIIIMAKQIHILVGAIPHGKTPIELITEIPESILNFNPELAFFGFFTLCVIAFMPFIKNPKIKSIPPALLALLVVIPMGLYWKLDQVHDYRFLGHNFSVGPSYLVDIPSNILNSIVFPDFSALSDIAAYKYILMISMIGSIESVLTVIAVDSITKKKSQLNRDLLGVGIGNLICSLLGGLPMISEVVRSKANIDNGATNRYSNFFHGLFLLLFVSLLVPVIREIPLAALAAMLIITGFRLASPKLFAHVLHVGIDQLLLFMTTLVMTLATDLLMGVMCGCALKVFLHLVRGASLKQMFTTNVSIENGVGQINIKVNGPAVFTNFLSFESEILNHCRNDKPIVVDFSGATLIDHTTLLSITTMANEIGNSRLTFCGLDKFARMSNHKLSTHRYT